MSLLAPHLQRRRTIFERLWMVCSGSGIYPTAILRYQQVPTSKKWGKALRDLVTQHHRFHPTLRLTESKVRQLVDDYWKANPDNRTNPCKTKFSTASSGTIAGVQVDIHVNFATAGPHLMVFWIYYNDTSTSKWRG